MNTTVLAVAELARARSHASAPPMALVRLLGQLARTIAALPPDAYRATPAPRVSGSIGEHVRHCLDHVAAFAASAPAAEMSYDSRLRGTAVETDPAAALGEIDRLSQELERLRAVSLRRPVRLDVLLERNGARVTAASSTGRELAYVIQHTVHHSAIIALLLDRLGIHPGGELGLAPSSPRRH